MFFVWMMCLLHLYPTTNRQGRFAPFKIATEVVTSEVVERHVSELDGTMKLLIRLQEPLAMCFNVCF